MKICYLANSGSIHTAKWLNHFARRGDQVEILTFESAQNIDANVTVHKLGKSRPMKVHYFTNGMLVRSLLKKIQPDLLHAHYASGYATLGRLAGFHPYIVSVWGTDIYEFAHKSAIHAGIIKANLRSADCVCSTSRIMADEIRKFSDRQIGLTPFGVDCEQFCPSPDNSNSDGEFIVGVVKTLEERYGIEYLIRAFAIFAKRVPKSSKLKLSIVGQGSLRFPLEQLARDLGVQEQTAFRGFVSHKEIPEILRRFSVFVAPSIGPESFGVAVVEASASGLPVVVSNIGGLPEVVKDQVTGILVPPRDPQAIANALEELWRDSQLCAELGANGRKFILENYEWAENASRMERLYESVLSQKASVPPIQWRETPSTSKRMS
jgi:L-malate glycosyltransferase